jgi:Flp pilus assembly pilin Flp
MLWTARLAIRSSAVALARRLGDERAATAVEYALMVALIAGVIIAAVSLLGQRTSGAFGSFNSSFSAASS